MINKESEDNATLKHSLLYPTEKPSRSSAEGAVRLSSSSSLLKIILKERLRKGTSSDDKQKKERRDS